MPAEALGEREPEPGGRRGRSGREERAAAEGGRRLPAPRPTPRAPRPLLPPWCDSRLRTAAWAALMYKFHKAGIRQNRPSYYVLSADD